MRGLPLLSFAWMLVPSGILALAACTATIEPGPSRPQACTMERAPVCGQRGGQSRTFANSCLARAAGFTVRHQGECLRMSPEPAPVACPLIEAPVCAARGDRRRSFANECLARAEGYRVVREGNCR